MHRTLRRWRWFEPRRNTEISGWNFHFSSSSVFRQVADAYINVRTLLYLIDPKFYNVDIDARIDIRSHLSCSAFFCRPVYPLESANCTNFNKFPSRRCISRGPYEFVSKEIWKVAKSLFWKGQLDSSRWPWGESTRWWGPIVKLPGPFLSSTFFVTIRQLSAPSNNASIYQFKLVPPYTRIFNFFFPFFLFLNLHFLFENLSSSIIHSLINFSFHLFSILFQRVESFISFNERYRVRANRAWVKRKEREKGRKDDSFATTVEETGGKGASLVEKLNLGRHVQT